MPDKRPIGKTATIIYVAAMAVMACDTFYSANALKVANFALDEERKSLSAEHAENERRHKISQDDRVEIKAQNRSLAAAVETNRAVIDRLLADLNEMRVRAGLPPVTRDE